MGLAWAFWLGRVGRGGWAGRWAWGGGGVGRLDCLSLEGFGASRPAWLARTGGGRCQPCGAVLLSAGCGTRAWKAPIPGP